MAFVVMLADGHAVSAANTGEVRKVCNVLGLEDLRNTEVLTGFAAMPVNTERRWNRSLSGYQFVYTVGADAKYKFWDHCIDAENYILKCDEKPTVYAVSETCMVAPAMSFVLPIGFPVYSYSMGAIGITRSCLERGIGLQYEIADAKTGEIEFVYDSDMEVTERVVADYIKMDGAEQLVKVLSDYKNSPWLKELILTAAAMVEEKYLETRNIIDAVRKLTAYRKQEE